MLISGNWGYLNSKNRFIYYCMLRKRNNDRENNFGETKRLEMTVVNVLPSQCERFELLISHAPPFSYITAHFKYNIVLLSDQMSYDIDIRNLDVIPQKDLREKYLYYISGEFEN